MRDSCGQPDERTGFAKGMMVVLDIAEWPLFGFGLRSYNLIGRGDKEG